MRPSVEQLQPDLVEGDDAFAESVFYEIPHGLISREARVKPCHRDRRRLELGFYRVGLALRVHVTGR